MAVSNKLHQHLPKSLFSRMLLTMLLTVLTSQAVVGMIWHTKNRQQEQESLNAVSHSLALGLASTVNFFQSLPFEYRHIVLKQLLNMGGTRYFVSFNQELIQITPDSISQDKQLVLDVVTNTLKEKLGGKPDIRVAFSQADNLHIFNNSVLLSDLPPSWATHTLTMAPLDPPILVTQVEVKPGEWIYLAALLPNPHMMLEGDTMPLQQIVFIIIGLLALMVVAYLLARWLVEPLKQLSEAAVKMGRDMESPPLSLTGTTEVDEAAQAFNLMQERIRAFIHDRDVLFSSISHDLKTPITRLRLRAELLEDEKQRSHFVRNLEELDLMVKSALQAVRDTDIHENREPTDLSQLLNQIIELLALPVEQVSLHSELSRKVLGKPLALKRCFLNVIDNAIKYGERAEITMTQSGSYAVVTVRDFGSGVPVSERQRVFDPYVRLQNVRSQAQGTGLGLSIVKNIVHAHHGTIELGNHPQGGLVVTIKLPF